MPDKPLILLAEDNASVRKMLVAILSRSGHEVVASADGTEAVNLAQRHLPDLLLLDIRMPGLNGIEALRRIRALPEMASTPAVMLTALSQRTEVVAAAKAGAADYIVKSGFDAKTFLARIDALLARRRARRPDSAAKPKSDSDAGSSAAPPTAAPGPADHPSAGPQPVGPKARLLQNAAALPELADRVPPLSPGSLAEKIQKIAEVKALPFVMPQVLALTGSQYSSATQLVNTIEQDIALTGKVLAMANSSIYRRSRNPVTDLAQAVKNVGFGSVRQAALGLGLMELFARQDDRPGIDRLGFWEHSFASATIARSLATRAEMDESQAFVVALLHNIGRLIMDEFLPDDYAGMIRLIESDRILPADLEKCWMGLDHAQLAQAVMRHWSMPGELCEPIGDHLLPMAALWNRPEPRRRWAGLVKTADYLASCLDFGDGRVEQIGHLNNDLVDDFAVDDAFLQELRDTVPHQLRELKLMMLVYMPKSGVQRTRCPVSDRVLLYLCPRPPHLDAVEFYLRLRHRHAETFTDVQAFLVRLEQAGPQSVAVVNLLANPPGDRTVAALDQWAAKSAIAADLRGLVLARPNQADQLTGAFGAAFEGHFAPVFLLRLNRFLGLAQPKQTESQPTD